MIWLYVALGGSIGAVMRFASVRMVHSVFGYGFPYGTLVVNVLGSFLIGVLSIWLLLKAQMPEEQRAFMQVGVLGAFTTFSSFSLETLHLVQQGDVLKAVVSVFGNVGLCVMFVWLGVQFARSQF